MEPDTLVEVTSTKLNPHVVPDLHIWEWQIPVYLFLGGLVAGLILLRAWTELRGRERELPAAARVAPLLALPLLGLGLLALFLDLELKLHVFRFYTTFRPTSPMSWGSWILLVVGASSLLAFLRAVTGGREGGGAPVLSRGLPGRLAAWAAEHRLGLARLDLFLGASLGVYTGILLGAFQARPLWNSALLGPLFLASGASTGVALVALFARQPEERHFLDRLDLGLIGLEAALLALWLVGLATGAGPDREAAGLLLGGPYTAPFWALVVTCGLAVPALVEWMALRRRWASTLLAPVLVLAGGLALRFILVEAGQSLPIGG